MVSLLLVLFCDDSVFQLVLGPRAGGLCSLDDTTVL
jgi:hypothetical protein